MPLHWRGEITGWYKAYSDALALFAMRALKPEVYRRCDPEFGFSRGPTGIDITIRKEGEEPKDVFGRPVVSIPVSEPEEITNGDPSILRQSSGQALRHGSGEPGSGQADES
jgi:hypothetical protein